MVHVRHAARPIELLPPALPQQRVYVVDPRTRGLAHLAAVVAKARRPVAGSRVVLLHIGLIGAGQIAACPVRLGCGFLGRKERRNRVRGTGEGILHGTCRRLKDIGIALRGLSRDRALFLGLLPCLPYLRLVCKGNLPQRGMQDPARLLRSQSGVSFLLRYPGKLPVAPLAAGSGVFHLRGKRVRRLQDSHRLLAVERARTVGGVVHMRIGSGYDLDNRRRTAFAVARLLVGTLLLHAAGALHRTVVGTARLVRPRKVNRGQRASVLGAMAVLSREGGVCGGASLFYGGIFSIYVRGVGLDRIIGCRVVIIGSFCLICFDVEVRSLLFTVVYRSLDVRYGGVHILA